MLCSAPGLWAQVYGGPAILSRGSGASVRPYGERSGRAAKIRAFVDISGVYDTGILPYELDKNGNFANPGGQYGVEAGVGVFGVKNFRRSTVGLDYRGTYRGYPQSSNTSGTDHFLGLQLSNQTNKRTTIEGHLTAGTSNRVFSFGNFIIGDSFANTLPINEVFDNRVYFLQGGASITYQPTARFSYVLGGDGFAVRRTAGQLVSVNGYTPRAGMAYRLSKRMQIGSVYQFEHFDYPRAFGEADVHIANGVLGYELGKRLTFEGSVSYFRSDSTGTHRVDADPVIQRLLGLTSVIESFARGTNRVGYSTTLVSRTKKTSLSVGAARTPGGGNGIALLAVNDHASVNFSYSADRKLSFGLTSSVSRLQSVSNDVGGNFITYFSGASANYFIARSFAFNTTFLYRHQELPLRTSLRNSYRMSVGITWSPGEVNLPVF